MCVEFQRVPFEILSCGVRLAGQWHSTPLVVGGRRGDFDGCLHGTNKTLDTDSAANILGLGGM